MPEEIKQAVEEKPVVDTKTADKPVADAAKATPEQKPVVEDKSKPVETKAEDKPVQKPAEELKTLLDEASEDEVKLGPDGKPIVAEAKVIPEKYTFKLPEGMTLDADKLAIVEPLFKSLGLDNDSAQKLVDLQLQMQKANEDAHVQAWETYLEGQKTESKAYFGTKLPEVMRNVARARDTFISKPLQEKLNVAGFSNDKDFLEALDKVGRVIGEGKFVEGKRSAPGKGTAGVETAQATEGVALTDVYAATYKK